MLAKQSLPIMYTHFQVSDLVGSDVCITILSWRTTKNEAPSHTSIANSLVPKVNKKTHTQCKRNYAQFFFRSSLTPSLFKHDDDIHSEIQPWQAISSAAPMNGVRRRKKQTNSRNHSNNNNEREFLQERLKTHKSTLHRDAKCNKLIHIRFSVFDFATAAVVISIAVCGLLRCACNRTKSDALISYKCFQFN